MLMSRNTIMKIVVVMTRKYGEDCNDDDGKEEEEKNELEEDDHSGTK